MTPIPSPSKETNSDVTRRKRSNSVAKVINYIQDPSKPTEHHLLHLEAEGELEGEDSSSPKSESFELPKPLPPSLPRPRKKVKRVPNSSNNYGPSYLRFLQSPKTSFKILLSVVILWSTWELLSKYLNLPLLTNQENPISPFLFISYPLNNGVFGEEIKYGKGIKDLLFLPYWIICFSFLRQGITQHVVRNLGLRLNISKGRKMERFMEQGYAVFYFGASSIFGLYVLQQQDSWFFQTKYFWFEYPHWQMSGVVKTYYLTQFAYWLQQALVMIAGLEKPRDDYVELVLHHIITLYLVGASYLLNYTQIGIAVFVSMDIPDLFLAISKCINYCGLETAANVSFVFFMFTWGYFRHYQNIRILNSVWNESILAPAATKVWDSSQGFYLPPWMKYQIFLPIFALQLVIAFWSYLILRIVFRMMMGKNASDVREEGEGETETEGGLSEAEGTLTPEVRRSKGTSESNKDK